MKLFSFKASHGNFGDDLNDWMWPKLLGDQLVRSPNSTLVGIGSILDKRLDLIDGVKIVFGSGIRATRNLPKIGGAVQIRFVRGPISAISLGHDTKWITDPAILVRALATKPAKTGNRIGLMPHYHTLPLLNWKKIAEDLDLVFIDPRASVEDTLSLLWKCERIITEAMHGAIVADALRIPWMRISVFAWRKEGFDVASLKWLDWGLSTGVDVTPIHLPLPQKPSNPFLLMPYTIENQVMGSKLKVSLGKLRHKPQYQLSNDDQHGALYERSLEQVQKLKQWLSTEPTD